MGEPDKINAVSALRDYVKDLKDEVHDLHEKLTQLRIDQAVTKTKLGIYVTVIAFGITAGVNLFFLWLKGKMP